VKQQVREDGRGVPQVTERGVTEPGLQTDSPPECQPSGRSLPGSGAITGGSSWVTGAAPEMLRFRGAGTAVLAGAGPGGTAGKL
jgi:hypothetical protein